MEIVRVTEADELSAEDQRSCEATKAWFKIDFVPKMSRVLLTVPEFGRPYGRASRRAMMDGALTRAQKELIATMVSAINVLRVLTRRPQRSREAARALRRSGLVRGGVCRRRHPCAQRRRRWSPSAAGVPPSTRQPVLPLPISPRRRHEVTTVFDEIVAFYALDRPPAVFQWMARDVGFVQSYWAATRQAFTDRALDRPMKEILAFAASMTAKSDYGVDFHLREARRLGLTDQALTEAVEVVQLFNTVTKIADALRLQPDFDPRRSDALGVRHPAPP